MRRIKATALGITVGLASSLLPLEVGLFAPLVVALVWSIWSYRKGVSLIPVGTAFVGACITMVIAARMPTKYMDETVAPAVVDVTTLRRFDLAYEDQDVYLMFMFPEDKWDLEIALPREALTIRELISYVERAAGLKHSGTRVCSFAYCNLLFGCPGDWVMFVDNESKG